MIDPSLVNGQPEGPGVAIPILTDRAVLDGVEERLVRKREAVNRSLFQVHHVELVGDQVDVHVAQAGLAGVAAPPLIGLVVVVLVVVVAAGVRHLQQGLDLASIEGDAVDAAGAGRPEARVSLVVGAHVESFARCIVG